MWPEREDCAWFLSTLHSVIPVLDSAMMGIFYTMETDNCCASGILHPSGELLLSI
jgi:hypothetical protein